jgi:hypothetical protein
MVMVTEAREGLGGLLAEHPVDGIGEVGLPAAVGADDGGDPGAGKAQLGAVREGLEPLKFDAFEFKQSSQSPQSNGQSCGTRRGPGSRGLRPW